MTLRILTTGERGIVGGAGDRGCPACRRPADDPILVDARGRWWHFGCVGAVLAEHTRYNEDREHARYRWETPIFGDGSFGEGSIGTVDDDLCTCGAPRGDHCKTAGGTGAWALPFDDGTPSLTLNASDAVCDRFMPAGAPR